MKNRNIPFGYRYENGDVVIHPKEAETLKSIFAAYLDGDSLLTIANRLNSNNIEYVPGATGWNKSRLMRIIEDERYIGTDIFPKLIDDSVQQAAKAVKAERNTQKGIDRTKDIFNLNVPVICSVCGAKMHRRYDGRLKCPTKWICGNKGCKDAIVLSDEELLRQITDNLNTVIRNPEKIIVPKEAEIKTDVELMKLDNEIGRLLDSPNTDKDILREKMLQRLSMQYMNIDHNAYTIRKMKAEIENMNPLTEFSAKITDHIVKAIKLNKDKTVSIILLNDQTIGRSDDVCR